MENIRIYIEAVKDHKGVIDHWAIWVYPQNDGEKTILAKVHSKKVFDRFLAAPGVIVGSEGKGFVFTRLLNLKGFFRDH